MNIVGLDLSLTATGYCRSGVAAQVLKPKTRGAERLNHFFDLFGSLWSIDKPDLIVVEGYSYGSVNGGERIGELGGVVRLQAHRHCIPVVEVPPTSLKKFATGKGNAGKDLMLASAVRQDAGIEDNNAADAYWLRELGLMAYEVAEGALTEADMPKYRFEVISKIEWPDLRKEVAA